MKKQQKLQQKNQKPVNEFDQKLEEEKGKKESFKSSRCSQQFDDLFNN